jgi:hypothetical protein
VSDAPEQEQTVPPTTVEPAEQLETAAPIEEAGDDEPVSTDGLSPADRKRLRLGWLGGTVPVLALYTWILTGGRLNFGHRQAFSGVFDAQARSLFHGRWDVPLSEIAFEGFQIDGKTYAYFGPFPSIIRMPILAVTDAFDGRLVALSMLAAMVVLAGAAFRLFCALRATVRGDAPVTRREVQLSALAAPAALIAPPFFLSSATLVYHEATLWGVALTVAAFNSVVRYQRDRTRRRLVIAVTVIILATLSRQTIALGPLLALGLAELVPLVRQFRRAAPSAGRLAALRAVAPGLGILALAGIAAIGPSVAVNYVKLDRFVGLPFEDQVFTSQSEHRRAVLDENPAMMGPEYVPTAAWTYLRPDGIAPRADFPWLDFPREGPTVAFPEPLFDTLDWSSSIPATAPALVVLSFGALVWSVRRRRQRPSDSPPLYPLVAGALGSAFGVLTIAYVANRYLADIYPLVLIGGIVGLWALSVEAPDWRAWLRRLALGGVIGLVALGTLTNVALSLSYQRERGHNTPQEWHAEYLGWRLNLPGSTPIVHIPLGTGAPPVADGTVLVVGECAEVYAGVRDRWLLVEEAPDDTLCRTAVGD